MKLLAAPASLARDLCDHRWRTPEAYSYRPGRGVGALDLTALGTAACTTSPIVPAAHDEQRAGALSQPDRDETLFVTQRKRLRNLNGMDGARNALEADLVTLAQHPAVSGTSSAPTASMTGHPSVRHHRC
jgi:hypothetical protein